MNTVFINKEVALHPSSLSNEYRDVLYKNLCDKFQNSCSIEHGYILDIDSQFKILSNKISNNTANVLFQIQFKANTLKPEIGIKLKCKIDMIFIHGIFAGINNLKVLIPVSTLTDYKFNTDKYIHKKTKKELYKGDEIIIELTDIRYNKQNYHCIGKIN
tara:strand:+ start:375 stop:851 length:477 start_codon:yes stop_codon:yes gene_type:complete